MLNNYIQNAMEGIKQNGCLALFQLWSLNAFIHNVEMAKHVLKFFRRLKYVPPFFNIVHEKVKKSESVRLTQKRK